MSIGCNGCTYIPGSQYAALGAFWVEKQLIHYSVGCQSFMVVEAAKHQSHSQRWDRKSAVHAVSHCT
jgi:hypothetical protein